MQIIAPMNSVRPGGEWKTKLRALLDVLDAESRAPDADVRRARRIRYRSLDVVVAVLDNHDRATCTFGVVTRNISTTGLAFLHKQMLAPGMSLRLDIPLLDQQILQVMARVRRCRHVRGMIHEVGVEFLTPAAAN